MLGRGISAFELQAFDFETPLSQGATYHLFSSTTGFGISLACCCRSPTGQTLTFTCLETWLQELDPAICSVRCVERLSSELLHRGAHHLHHSSEPLAPDLPAFTLGRR